MAVTSFHKGKHDKSTTLSIIDIYMNVVDENDNMTWRTIYKKIDEIYFEKSKKKTHEFLGLCKKSECAIDHLK